MIVFNNVRFKYPYDEFELLKGVSFTFEKGVNTLLADTQSGKSTIAKLLCRQISVCGGSITVDEKPICGITDANLGILYLSDKPTFFENRSVLYNVEYPLKVRKTEKTERKRAALEALAEFGIDNIKTPVKKLDFEQRSLLALARGATVQRKIVLFDDFFRRETVSEQTERTLNSFDCEIKVILTSNVAMAHGKTVILDGGLVVYDGDAEGARKYKENLSWIYDIE